MECLPIVEGGKGIGVSNFATASAFAKCGAVGTISAVNPDIVDENGEVTNQELTFFYRKIENGCDDKYYFRKFKQLKNYEYEQCVVGTDDWDEASVSAITTLKEPTIISENSPKFLRLGNDYFKKIVTSYNDLPVKVNQ